METLTSNVFYGQIKAIKVSLVTAMDICYVSSLSEMNKNASKYNTLENGTSTVCLFDFESRSLF